MVGKGSKRGSQNGCRWGVLGGESSCCRRHQGSLQEETPQHRGVKTSQDRSWRGPRREAVLKMRNELA